MSTVIDRPVMLETDEELLDQIQWVERRIVNSFNPEFFVERLTARIEESLEVGVANAAVVLDEFVPDWHLRIDREIVMTSVYSCVLGQVFGDESLSRVDGYLRGMLFFKSVGYCPPKFVFSSEHARPFWDAEITKRAGGKG